MPERRWTSANIKEDYYDRPDIIKYNEKEWTLGDNPHCIFIVQPRLQIELYELWVRNPDCCGDRYDDGRYKCISSFPTLEAAKAAYLVYESTLS